MLIIGLVLRLGELRDQFTKMHESTSEAISNRGVDWQASNRDNLYRCR